MHVVYALFRDADAADRIRAELSRGGAKGPGYEVQPHEHRLDPDRLPEGATTFGRNMVVSTAIGTVFFMIVGLGLGLYEVIPGVGVGMGLMLGFISGVVIGVYTAMQAGTRVAKPEVAELAPRLTEGAVLLTIETHTRTEADRLADQLDDHGADETGVC